MVKGMPKSRPLSSPILWKCLLNFLLFHLFSSYSMACSSLRGAIFLLKTNNLSVSVNRFLEPILRGSQYTFYKFTFESCVSLCNFMIQIHIIKCTENSTPAYAPDYSVQKCQAGKIFCAFDYICVNCIYIQKQTKTWLLTNFAKFDSWMSTGLEHTYN